MSIFTGHRGIQRWHCHGCGAGGTAIDLVLGVGRARDFREALEWLGERTNVSPTITPPPRARPTSLAQRPSGPDASTRRALTAYVDGCVAHLHSPGGVEVLQWLTETRAVPPSVLRHVGVGADPGSWELPRPRGIPAVSPAAVFPIRRPDGDVVFTQSRVLHPLDELPRWVSTASTVAPNPRVAFLAPPGARPTGPVIVTEGMLDALSAVSAGRPAAAILGTGAIDEPVAERLAWLQRPLILATDNDPAGYRACDRLTSLLAEHGVVPRTLTIPDRFNDLNDWHVACRDRWPESLTAAIKLTMSGAGQKRPTAGLTGIA